MHGCLPANIIGKDLKFTANLPIFLIIGGLFCSRLKGWCLSVFMKMLVRGGVQVLRLKWQRSVRKFGELAASISLLPTPDFKEGRIARSGKVKCGNAEPELYIVRPRLVSFTWEWFPNCKFPSISPLSMPACPLLSYEREFIIGGWRYMSIKECDWVEGKEEQWWLIYIHFLLQQIRTKCLLVMCRHIAGVGAIPEQNKGLALWEDRECVKVIICRGGVRRIWGADQGKT